MTMIEQSSTGLSIKKQCELLSIPRSCYYYEPVKESELNLLLMKEIDKEYLRSPSYGYRTMTHHLKRLDYDVNYKRIYRLMKLMAIQAIYPKPKTTLANKLHMKYPYLLSDVKASSQNHVWASDITYIPLDGGFIYLVAVLDLYSRFILSWKISNTLDTSFCLEALEEALKFGSPQIFNTDQGCQYTSLSFTNRLKASDIQVSMSGKGRCMDNIFVERFWRTLKYEEVFLKVYKNSQDAVLNISNYMKYYNNHRLHSSLKYKPPIEIYNQDKARVSC